MRLIKTATICGKRWKFLWQAPPEKEQADGMCHFATRTIQINPHLAPKRMMEVISHEIAHAIEDTMEESRALAFGEVVADVQFRMGYRA